MGYLILHVLDKLNYVHYIYALLCAYMRTANSSVAIPDEGTVHAYTIICMSRL